MSELEKESQRIDHIVYSASYQNMRERERRKREKGGAVGDGERESREMNVGNKFVSGLIPWYSGHHMGQINSMVQGYPVF